MARLALTITLIFSLFLPSHSRLQPIDPQENLVVNWEPSISTDRPHSTSNSYHPIDSDIEHTILLPSQKPIEDAVLSEEIAQCESTTKDTELPEFEAVTVTVPVTVSSFDDEHLEHHKKHKKHGLLYHIFHLFHKHCHHHKKDKESNKGLDEEEEKHKKHGIFFHLFHKHCHRQKKDKKEKEIMEEKDQRVKLFEPRIARGGEIPYGILHGKRVHHYYKPFGEGEGMMMRFKAR